MLSRNHKVGWISLGQARLGSVLHQSSGPALRRKRDGGCQRIQRHRVAFSPAGNPGPRFWDAIRSRVWSGYLGKVVKIGA
jgi:hypothetical protein